ncbi:hypothetical protein AP460_00200 [Actinobacillus pleuropneumoniae]|nr:hypothetical protein AP518_00496 [Actinobacillus pleuropneumoniae]KIE92967.1 hypothetical protein AP1022_00485 [Actinobacillus pleuropneumoniae]KIE93674.1 hypothetical protein AP460_00200 [Actinobacillus pleuropneumoniae]KIE99536.1 hypothetical protein AP597_00533 [Actinobacillus pleuropneumoniae]
MPVSSLVSYTIRVFVSPSLPSTPGLPCLTVIEPLEPSLPLMPIVPSLPFKATPVLPSLPCTPSCPSTPSFPSLPGPPTVKLLFKSNVTLLPAFVITILPSVFAKSTVLFGATFEALVLSPFVVRFQPALAVAFTPSNWSLFTASVPFTPGATFVMVLLPLFKPLSVKLTTSPSLGVIVKPLPPIVALISPVLKVALVKSVKDFAILMINSPFWSLSLSTRKFLSVTVAFASKLPLIANVSFSFF